MSQSQSTNTFCIRRKLSKDMDGSKNMFQCFITQLPLEHKKNEQEIMMEEEEEEDYDNPNNYSEEETNENDEDYYDQYNENTCRHQNCDNP